MKLGPCQGWVGIGLGISDDIEGIRVIVGVSFLPNVEKCGTRRSMGEGLELGGQSTVESNLLHPAVGHWCGISPTKTSQMGSTRESSSLKGGTSFDKCHLVYSTLQHIFTLGWSPTPYLQQQSII